MLRFTAGFLSCVCIIGGLWHFGILKNSLLDSLTERDKAVVKSINSSTSPTGEYAVITNQASDKSGWCELRTNVHRNDQPFDWERQFVFIADCGTTLEFKWASEKELIVFYSAPNTADGVKTYQQFRSEDQAIKISYVLRQPTASNVVARWQ